MDHCPNCHAEYGKRKRCYKCQPGRARNRVSCVCAICTQPFEVQANQAKHGEGKYCSVPCANEGLRRVLVKPLDQRPKYINKQGYIMVPIAARRRGPSGGDYRAEHRMIMEAHIGRHLSRNEHVHHINENKSDNRLENLELLTNSEHQKRHGFKGRKR